MDMILQPIILVIRERLECAVCQAKAIFLILEAEEDEQLSYTAYCQDCWKRRGEE